jgi:hypothetical protein
MPKRDKTTKDDYPTDKTVVDDIHTFVRIAAGSIGASELLNHLVAPPLEKRRDEFFKDVGRRLKNLEDRGDISLEELQENEKFIDICLLATQAALRTSEKEKRAALRNAIIKSAKPVSPELAVQQMFINYVDSFTVWHIKILDLVNDPKGWAEKNNYKFKDDQDTRIIDILEDAFPKFRGGRDFYKQFWKDLQFRSLVTVEDVQSEATDETLHKHITLPGKDFFIYIAEEE